MEKEWKADDQDVYIIGSAGGKSPSRQNKVDTSIIGARVADISLRKAD